MNSVFYNVRLFALLLLLVVVSERAVKAEGLQFNFLRIHEIEQLKDAINNPTIELQEYILVLQHVADSLLKIGPWSVTDYQCPQAHIDPHDYYSESTYWWPDPKNPELSYIRKDGVRNPDRFLKHKDALNTLCHSTLILSTAAYLFDNQQYADRAKEYIRVWFITPETRMNPNAKYAQVIPNSDKQRGVGILDTRRFVFLLEGVGLLKLAGFWDVELEAELHSWFSEYLDWLLNSYYGKDERQRGNNHSSWYAVQVAACANFTGNQEVIKETWKYAHYSLLEKQITENGKMPLEMERTRSLSYFMFNLEAWSLLGRVTETDSINFWLLENSHSGSLVKSVDFILPYLENPEDWQLAQITTFRLREQMFLLFSAESLDKPHMIELYQSVMSPEIIKDDTFLFILNMMVIAGVF